MPRMQLSMSGFRLLDYVGMSNYVFWYIPYANRFAGNQVSVGLRNFGMLSHHNDLGGMTKTETNSVTSVSPPPLLCL